MSRRPPSKGAEAAGALTQRLFVASSVACARGPASMLEEVAHCSDGLRTVPKGSEHVTHVFLGERALDVERLERALAPVADLAPVTLALGGVGVFPARGRPRLLCRNVVDNASEVRRLSATVLDCLRRLLPDLEGYRLKPPHVTLARFGRRAGPADARRTRRLIETHGLDRWSDLETLRRVEIVRSELHPGGARYATLSTLELRG